MRLLLILLLLVAACTSASDRPGEGAETPDSSHVEPAAVPVDDPAWAERKEITARFPELAACTERWIAENGAEDPGLRRVEAWADYSFIEVRCGRAPGTGAYGWPLALVVQWQDQYFLTDFVEQREDGGYARVGPVTQAIPLYDRAEDAYFLLLYKYAGAGQCGLLVEYEVPAEGSPLAAMSARERSCDAAPCEDEACYDPLNWPQVELQYD